MLWYSFQVSVSPCTQLLLFVSSCGDYSPSLYIWAGLSDLLDQQNVVEMTSWDFYGQVIRSLAASSGSLWILNRGIFPLGIQLPFEKSKAHGEAMCLCPVDGPHLAPPRCQSRRNDRTWTVGNVIQWLNQIQLWPPGLETSKSVLFWANLSLLLLTIKCILNDTKEHRISTS